MTTDAKPQQSESAPDPIGLPDPVARRGVTEAAWRTLCESLFPGANPRSVLMVIDYCKARKLDPLKKPCHIVPMRVKDAKTNEYGWRDVVMPGIYEYRTTAMRTGHYLGHSRPEYGPMVPYKHVTAPEWCEMTFYRSTPGGQRIEFPVRRYFAEVVGVDREGKPNDRWTRAPIQMLDKCVEAAGLREAFPDEFGGEITADEMDDQRVVDISTHAAPPKPAARKSELPAPSAGAVEVEKLAADIKSASEAEKVASDFKANTVIMGATVPIASDAPAAKHEPKQETRAGLIVDVKDLQKGTLIKFADGFQCATTKEGVILVAHRCHKNKTPAEVTTLPASDPRFTPRVVSLVELQPETGA